MFVSCRLQSHSIVLWQLLPILSCAVSLVSQSCPSLTPVCLPTPLNFTCVFFVECFSNECLFFLHRQFAARCKTVSVIVSVPAKPTSETVIRVNMVGWHMVSVHFFYAHLDSWVTQVRLLVPVIWVHFSGQFLLDVLWITHGQQLECWQINISVCLF